MDKITFTDTHAHYDDERYDGGREELFEQLLLNGAEFVINAASSYDAMKKGIALAEKYPFIYAAAGVHPHYTDDLTEGMFADIEVLCQKEKVVAIGETGLDFYYEHSKKDTQRYWFKRFLELAKKINLPVIIHSRDAAQEVYDTIFENKAGLRGVIHCYSGSYETARDYIKTGFYIGIGGVITFKNAKKLVEVVEKIPLDKILLETDCPYLSPEPNRGKRNDSLNIKYIAQKIAEIKGIGYDEVCRVTSMSARELFGV